MKKDSIDLAILEAQRFIEKANAYKDATSIPSHTYEYDGKKRTVYPSAPKESGALRRSSMDLTRALAEMRKPE